MAGKTRIGVTGVMHETNSFAPGKTELNAFCNHWVEGKEAFIKRYRGTKTSMGGVIDAAEMYSLELVPGFFTYATPSGIVSGETVEVLIDKVVQSVPQDLDGLVVILHGAMVAETYDDVEAEILQRLRKRCGEGLPVAVTLDLHGNGSREMVEHGDIFVGYKTYPHVDAYDRALEAVKLLTDTVDQRIRPVTYWQHANMLVAPQAMITEQGAMHELMQLAFEMERRDGVLNVTVLGGFPYSDIPNAGMSFIVTTDDDELLAKQICEQLCYFAWERRDSFVVHEYLVEDAIKLSLSNEDGPDIFIEGSDNVGGGAPADATHTLKHLVRLDRKSLIVIRDVAAVRQAHRQGVGTTLDCEIGGKSDRLHGHPVPIQGRIRLLFDGQYRHAGPYMTGQLANMGKTAVVEAGLTTIILTEERTAPWDIEHVRVLGIDPRQFKIIVVKSAVAWRTAFGSFAKQVYCLNTPGCCSANLHHFQYDKLKRPIYPLDKNAFACCERRSNLCD